MAATPAIPVQVAVVLRRDVPRVIESIGNVQSQRGVAIKSQVDGIIAQIHFREGDDVKAADLVVTLDRRPFETGLLLARAGLVNARTEAAQAPAATPSSARLRRLSTFTSINSPRPCRHKNPAGARLGDPVMAK